MQVYIYFTHKTSNNKYVGSSNDLSRRFKQSFEKKNVLFNNKTTILLLPLIKKKGFEAFALEIIVIPSSYFKYSYCFLGLYYLLDK
jgi:predicted GIY-YIG superfamily endonuclease